MIDNDYPVLYVIVRTDMASMNTGKAMAHSAHAANAFAFRMNSLSKSKLDSHEKYYDLFKKWEQSTNQGFGTQINLKANWTDALYIQTGK